MRVLAVRDRYLRSQLSGEKDVVDEARLLAEAGELGSAARRVLLREQTTRLLDISDEAREVPEVA